jgi:hypothetical protein
MSNFRLYYDLNKHIFDRESILGLHAVSHAITVIGPLTRVNIYGIVNIDCDSF